MDQRGRSRGSPSKSHQKDPSPSIPMQVQSYFGADDDTGIDDTIDLGDFSAYADALSAAQAVQHHQEQEQMRKASGLDGLEDTPDGKRGRGRPKGSKNKPGHRAGRPRKSLLSETGEEMSPKPKRARTISSLPVHHSDHSHSLPHDSDSHQSSSLSSFAMGLSDNPYQHLLASQPHALQQAHHHAGDIPVDPSLMPAQRHHSHSHNHNGNNENTSLERLSAELFGPASASASTSRSNQPTPSTSSATPTLQAQAQADAAMAYFTRQNIVPGPSSGIGASSGLGEVDSETVAAIQSSLNDATLQSLAALVPNNNNNNNVNRNTATPVSTAAIMKTISDLMPGKPTILGPLELITSTDRDGSMATQHRLESLEQDLVEQGDKGIYVFVANYQGNLDGLKESIALAATAKKSVGLPAAGVKGGSGTSGAKGGNGARDKGKGVAGRKSTAKASPLREAIANSEQSKSSASDPITPSSTLNSKQASRGPRKCGHCGDYECKGRGGRTYCQKFLDGEPSVVTGPRKHRKSVPPAHVVEHLEAKKKGKPEERRLSEGFGSRRREGAGIDVDQLDVIVGEQEQGRAPGEGSDEGGDGEDQEDSVQALIQSLHASTSTPTSAAVGNNGSSNSLRNKHNGFSKTSSSSNGTQQYADPGAPTPDFAPGGASYAGGKARGSSKASGSGGNR